MEVIEPLSKKTSNYARLNNLSFNFLFFIITTVFSLGTSAQPICVASIDGTINEFCLSAGPITFPNATASGENIEWLSSGDGTFNDASSINPTYTPGPNDIANGYVFIYLDVYNDDPVDPCSELPLVTLLLGTMNAIATPAAQTICSGSAITRILFSGGLSGIVYNWTRNNTASVTGIAASGSGSILGPLTNTTTAPVTVTFTITPTSTTCSGTPITATVLVNPRPNVVRTPASQTICSGSRITPIELTGGVNGTTYAWTRNNTASVTGIAASGSGNITGLLTNTTASPVTVTFTIIPTANGCTGTAVTSTVTVNPTANVVVATPSAQTICSAVTITPIVLSGGSGGTTYTWTRNNTASVTGIAASGSGTISGALTNTTAAPVYVTFTITASSSGCTNRATVLVNPRPTLTRTPSSQTICSGATIASIVLSSNVNNTTYNWTRNNTVSVTGIAASGSGNITGALTNTTASPVTVTFTITPISAGCSGTSTTATVLVNPLPGAASATPSSQTICSGASITTIALSGSGGGTVYNWSRNNTVSVTGIAASGSGNITGALTNTTGSPVTVTFTITPTANSCPGTPITAAVTVNPRPTSVISGDQTVCAGQSPSNISIALTGTAPWNFTYSDGTTPVTVTGNNTNPYTFTPPALPRTYTVTSLSDANCTAQSGDRTGSATLSQLNYAITASAGANGSISPSGVTNVNCGTNQVYTITPNGGFNIQDVLVDGISQGAVATYTFSNVTATHTISATFSAGAFTITAGAGTNGTITPAGAVGVTGGANQTFNIAANSCYQIADVLVDGVSAGAVSTYTFNNVTAPHNISATFAQLNYIITASAGANGTISPNGATSVNCGQNQTYTIAANSCYQIADVLVDGISQGAVTTYTFTNVTATHSISATFSQLSYTITASAGANGTITPNGATSVNCGASQAYTITPNGGFNIQDVLVDGISQGAVATYSFTNVTAPHTISAVFSSGAFIITASAGANGTITPAGAVGVASGANQTFSIAANSCYQIADVLVDGISQGAITSYTFNNVTAPHSISATFSQLSYTITASAGANGTITPSGANSINCGENQTYTIAANSCYQIADVLVDGISQGAITTYTFTNVTATHSISATFSQLSYTITASAGAKGTISPNGATSVNCGASQAYTITPDGGFNIQDVLVDGISQGAVATYSFTNVTAPHTISAVFSSGAFTITASAGANGTITPAGAVGVASGANQTFSIAANSCYQIADVLVDGISQGAVTSYTFNNVTAPHTISAAFSQLNYTITASAGANGSISPNGVTSVNCGANQTFSIAANSCYQIADVLVDGISQGAITTYTFTNVTAPHSISATFTQLSYTITASAGANGTITPNGATSVNCGANQIFNITANAGFTVQSVLVDGISQGAVTNYTFSNVTENHTVSATFTAVAGCTAPTLSTSLTNILCRNSSTGAINLTTSGGTAPFTYAWTGPNGFTAATEDISGLLAGSYSVTVTATGGCSASSTVTITQPAAALTATATAAAMACNGLTTTLTVTAAGGTGARQYSLNGGAFQAGNTFTVNAAGSPYTVTVRDANLCTVITNSVTVAPAATTVPGTPAGINGPVYGLCGGGTFTYTVIPVAGATSYFWTGPTGFTVVSGQNTGTVQISVPATFTGSGGIWASPRNACGSGTGYRLNVSAVLSYPGSSISGPGTVTPGQTNVQYSLPNTAGATYAWLVPSGAVITGGQGTSAIIVNFGTTSGNVSVDITNACGTGPRVSRAVTVAASKPITSNQILPAKTGAANQLVKTETYFSVYPNPAQSNATVVFSSLKKGTKFEVVISNTIGENLLTTSGVTFAGKNMLQFDLGKFKNGIYLVRLITKEHIQTQKLFKGK